MAKATLADLVAFQTVAAHRSFRQAADALGQSRSALSHAMRGLEAQLGARLLNRTTRSVAPTELGQRLLERIGPLLRELDDALAQVSQAQGRVRGTLRINTSESAARLLLQQVVPRFLAAHPDVELDLVADGRLVDVVEQGFDAGIRLGESLPQDMVGVPIGGPLRFIAVASPGYLADRAPPALPEDLRQHRGTRNAQQNRDAQREQHAQPHPVGEARERRERRRDAQHVAPRLVAMLRARGEARRPDPQRALLRRDGDGASGGQRLLDVPAALVQHHHAVFSLDPKRPAMGCHRRSIIIVTGALEVAVLLVNGVRERQRTT